MDWLLYDMDLRHERVKANMSSSNYWETEIIISRIYHIVLWATWPTFFSRTMSNVDRYFDHSCLCESKLCACSLELKK